MIQVHKIMNIILEQRNKQHHVVIDSQIIKYDALEYFCIV